MMVIVMRRTFVIHGNGDADDYGDVGDDGGG